MKPKISIIIPVYNVAQYLRQCLDSVLGQTLQEIQVICVDHSSTDGSLAILEEFAANDARIEIIHCENTGGGPGQARNAALPHVKGKYLYFVDSDDWLDSTLCEKAYYRLEQSEDDIMFFHAHEVSERGQASKKEAQVGMAMWSIRSDASNYFDFTMTPWNRVIRTSYLQKHNLRYIEGNMSEDTYFHWTLLSNQPRVIFLPQNLYYYRHRSNSQAGSRGEYLSNLAIVYSRIKKYLMDTGKYKKFRTEFLTQKLWHVVWIHNYILPEFRDAMKQSILKSLDDDEIVFIKESKNISPAVLHFYHELLGWEQEHQTQKCPRHVYPLKNYRTIMRSLERFIKKANRIVMRPLESLARNVQGKSKKFTPSGTTANPNNVELCHPVETGADRQIRELSELVCQLSKEIVELRNQSQHDATWHREKIA